MQFRTVDFGLNEVLALHPKLYDLHMVDFSSGKLSPKREGIASIGLIAQDVYEVVLQAVNKTQNQDLEA